LSAPTASKARRSTRPTDRVALVSERDFLLRSLADLDREHAAGEVSDEDYAKLRDRDRARLGTVEEALGALGEPETSDVDSKSPARASAASLRRFLGARRTRTVVGIGAAACFAVAAVLLMLAATGVRLPGETASGSVTLSSAQQVQETLDRAAILGTEGQVAEAVSLYEQVLAVDPSQPDALAYGGWLIRLSGLAGRDALAVARGDEMMQQAVAVAPGYPDAHGLYGVALYADRGDPVGAVAQFREVLGLRPSTSLVASIAPVARLAFAAAHTLLPARYEAALRSAKA